MAVYKVIQDIEAEDKLLGPLTLRGFIYAITAGFLAFLCVKISISTEITNYRFFGVFILFWPTLLFGVLASPLGGEQPTEVWLLSHIRYIVKPKIRIWSQLGQASLVTITAPKKVEQHLTKELTQPEVHSRLETLAMTMDSRGWAIKNVYPDASGTSQVPFTYLNADKTDSDRLVKRNFASDSPIADIHPSEDVLDLENSPRAQEVENMLLQKTVEQKEKRMVKLDSVIQKAKASTMTVKAKSGRINAAATKVAKTSSKVRKPKKPLNPRFAALAQADELTIDSISKMASAPASGPRITKIAPGEVEIKLH